MKERRKSFLFHKTPARIYAWYLRRRGYETKIEEWEDQFPSGWLWSFGYEVIAVCDECGLNHGVDDEVDEYE